MGNYGVVRDDAQTRFGEEVEVLKQQGFIRNLTITPRDGKDSMYKFQVRFLNSEDKLVEPEDWYSGFKEFPGVDGDYIVFTWKKNGQWNNVKEIIDIKNTHDQPDEHDVTAVQEVQLDNDSPELKSDYEGDNATIANVIPKEVISREDLDKPYKALLLNGTIHLCTKRGNLTEAEIISQFNRFLEIL